MSMPFGLLVPLAFVRDVPGSIEFYGRMGFEVHNAFTPPDQSEPSWAWLASGKASLMLAKATDPVIAEQQAVLFYLYVLDVPGKHAELAEKGLSPSEITYPFYNPKGEFRVVDPDGYVLWIAHA